VMSSSAWIGVDLDGTLAVYPPKPGSLIGDPVMPMLTQVIRWVKQGKEVKIFTARVNPQDSEWEKMRDAIDGWCLEHVGKILPTTCAKDYMMTELYDDRAVQIIPNTGKRADGRPLQ
jgi:hypothetical protein